MKMIKQYIIFLILLISQITSSMLFAEGTKQIKNQVTDVIGIVIYESNAGRPFANYDCAPENRLNIRINEVGEVVNYGFQCLPDINNPACTNPLKYRVKDPNGTVLFEYAMPTTGQQGYINSYAEAVTGPSNITAGGYNALSFTPTMTGDYSIEFEKVSQTCINYGLNYTFIDHFDITVSKNNKAIDGRLWSQSWQLTTQNINNKFNGDFFVYSDDHIVTKIDFEGLQPIVFTVAANSFGNSNTGLPLTDRKSLDNVNVFANPGIPQYKIFLNDPDINCFPSGVFGDFDSDITVVNNSVTPCGRIYCVNVNVTQAGHLDVLLDFNGTPGYQANTTDIKIGADVVAGHNCIKWDGKDGLGNFITEANNVVVVADYINGLTNLPLYDAELNTTGFSVTLIRPTTLQPPSIYWDDSNINLPGGIFGDVNLTGCTGFCHSWSTYNVIDSSYQDYGNKNTINSWWYCSKTTKTAVLNIPPIMAPPVLKYCSTKGTAIDLSIGNGKTYIWYKDSLTTKPINSTILASTGDTVIWNPAGSSGDQVFYINLPPALPFSNLGPTTLDYTSWNGNPGTKLQILTSSKVILKSVDIETGWGTGCGNNDTISINTTPVQSVIVKTTCGAAKKTVNLDFLLDMGGLYTLTSSNRLKYSITSGITSIQDVVRIIPFKVENTTSTYTAFANMKFITPPGCEPIPIKVNLKDTCCSPATITIQPINDTLCVDGTSKAAFSITATAASGVISYQWQTDNGTGTWTDITNATSSTYQTPVVTTSMNNYKYKCIVYLDGSCPVTSDAVILKAFAIPTASITGQSTICPGESTTLSANGAGTYQWDNGSTAATYNVSPTTTTSYALTISSNGCTKTTQFTVIVNALPTVDAGANQIICKDSPVMFSATTTATVNNYSWSSDAATNTSNGSTSSVTYELINKTINTDQHIIYTISITDNNGCFATDTVSVTFKNICGPSIKINAKDTSLCAGDSTKLFGSIFSQKKLNTLTLNDGASASNISFSGSSSPYSIDSIIIKPAFTTIYTVRVTDIDGSEDVATITINVHPHPSIASTIDSICFSSKASLTASDAGANGTYLWNTNDAVRTITVSPTNNTTYSILITNSYNCRSKETKLVIVNPLPSITFSPFPNNLCANDTLFPLTQASSSGKGIGVNTTNFNAKEAGIGDHTITYTFTDEKKCVNSASQTIKVYSIPVSPEIPGSICKGEMIRLNANNSGADFLWSTNESTQYIDVKPSTTGNHKYSVTITANNCKANYDINLTVNDMPTISMEKLIGCQPFSANIIATTDIPSNDFTWNFGDPISGLKNIAETKNNKTQHLYADSGNYTVSVKATSTNGCKVNQTFTDIITVKKRPVTLFIFSPPNPSNINPDVKFKDMTSGLITQRSWSFDDAAGTSELFDDKNPEHTFSKPGTYYVLLMTETDNGCKDSLIIPVIVKAEHTLYAPNAFTPNNDGLNETFKPVGIGIDHEKFELYIYTRWGELIFQGHNYEDEWKGDKFNNGKIVPDGIYTWLVKYKDLEGKEFDKSGMVIVIH